MESNPGLLRGKQVLCHRAMPLLGTSVVCVTEKKVTEYVTRYAKEKGTRYRPALPIKKVNALPLPLPKKSNGRYFCRYSMIRNLNQRTFAAGTYNSNFIKLIFIFHINVLAETTILLEVLI